VAPPGCHGQQFLPRWLALRSIRVALNFRVICLRQDYQDIVLACPDGGAMELSAPHRIAEGSVGMPTPPAISDIGKRLRGACDRRSLLRGFIVSAGGVVLMFCCLTILTLSSCVLGQ
jgi:hypothetical protein